MKKPPKDRKPLLTVTVAHLLPLVELAERYKMASNKQALQDDQPLPTPPRPPAR